MLRAAIESARELALPALTFTFANHPQNVIDPAHRPNLLTTPRRRIHLLAQLGFDYVVSPSFTRDFADLSAREFVESILLARFNCRVVVVGFNYHFGRNREGDPEILREVMEETGAKAIVVDPLIVEGEPVSSTRIRRLIAAGDMEAAAALLGRWHDFEGVVVPGTGKARDLGFPTANVLVDVSLVLPPYGVYCGRAKITGEETDHPALIYYGSRPLERKMNPDLDVSLLPHIVEVHLLDGRHELSNRMLVVSLGPRIRGEMHFSSETELHEQLARDREAALGWKKDPGSRI